MDAFRLEKAGGTATITLRRPEKMNALTRGHIFVKTPPAVFTDKVSAGRPEL